MSTGITASFIGIIPGPEPRVPEDRWLLRVLPDGRGTVAAMGQRCQRFLQNESRWRSDAQGLVFAKQLGELSAICETTYRCLTRMKWDGMDRTARDIVIALGWEWQRKYSERDWPSPWPVWIARGWDRLRELERERQVRYGIAPGRLGSSTAPSVWLERGLREEVIRARARAIINDAARRRDSELMELWRIIKYANRQTIIHRESDRWQRAIQRKYLENGGYERPCEHWQARRKYSPRAYRVTYPGYPKSWGREEFEARRRGGRRRWSGWSRGWRDGE